MTDLNELLKIKEFRDLDDVALVELAENACIERLQAGDRLVAEKIADKVAYLLSGALDIQTTGGVHQSVAAASERAEKPLFMSSTPGHYARCTKASRVLLVDKVTIDKYGITHQRGANELDYGEFDTLPAGDSSLALMNEITKQFESKSITLPSIPEVAIYINSVISRKELNAKQLARIIQMDPIIAARVMQAANKPLKTTASEYRSIREAIERIGLDGLRTIVSAVVLRDLFMPGSELIVKRFNQFYEHSIRIGVICYELAKRLKGFDKRHAFLLGVLHDIGVVPILVVADRHTELAYKAGNLEHVLRQLKSYIGGVMLQQWGFGEDYRDVVKHAYHWDRKVGKADYCDLVQVALMHSHLVGGSKIDGPDLFDLPAFKRLGLDKVNPVNNMQLLKEMTTRVDNLIRKICR